MVLRNYSGGIGGTGGGSIISPLPSGCTTICAPADAPSVADQRARLLVEAQRQADAERRFPPRGLTRLAVTPSAQR